jgi:hypothetical protein
MLSLPKLIIVPNLEICMYASRQFHFWELLRFIKIAEYVIHGLNFTFYLLSENEIVIHC